MEMVYIPIQEIKNYSTSKNLIVFLDLMLIFEKNKNIFSF